MDVLRKAPIYNRDVSVAIAGLEDSGKTTLVNQLLRGESVQTYSTFGVNQELLKTDGLVLGITDLGGRESFRKTLWESFISKSDALIYVTDATRRNRLNESKAWFTKSLSWLNEESPVLVLINKLDQKVHDDTIQTIITEFKKSIRRKNINYMETSTLTGENIDKTVDWLASKIIKQLILDKIIVEMFIAYIKTDKGIIEATIRTPRSDVTTDVLSPVIRYKFVSSDEPTIEFLFYNNRQFIMAANNEISCWLVTSQKEEIKSTNLLIKLLAEFVKEIHGLRKDKENLNESDLNKFLISHLVDNQVFWSKTQTPLFEISILEERDID